MTYSIRQADLQIDKDLMIGLWKRNLPGFAEKRYEWIYENNPGGPPTTILLNHDKSDTIVGAISLFPRTLFADGRRLQSHVLGDLAVDKCHRAIGPALKLLKAAIARCESIGTGILLGFPNSLSEPVTRRAGFQLLGDINEMTLVLRTYPYVLKYIPAPIISRLIAYPLDLLLWLRRLKMCQIYSNQYENQVTDAAGESFEALWSRLSNQVALIGERDRRYLTWRFSMSPYAKYSAFTVLQKNSKELLGYIIFSTRNKMVSVADIGTTTTNQALRILISGFSKYQKTNGFESISFGVAGDPNLIKNLNGLGFSIRLKELKIMVYAPSNYQGIIGSIQNRCWYLTAADNDI